MKKPWISNNQPQKSQVMFHMKKTQLVSQLVQGTFPKYSQLIPQSFAGRATVSVADFLRACKMASIFARDGSGIVRLIMTPGGEMLGAGQDCHFLQIGRTGRGYR